MSNLFANAKAAAPAKPAKPAKKDEKQHIEIKGLHTVAAIDSLIKTLEGIKATAAADVKVAAMDKFVELGTESGKKPESFRGTDGDASASVELRKRGENSKLSPAEVELLTQHGVPVKEVVAVEERFVINPTYMSDSKFLEKVSRLLEGKVPADFIQFQNKQSATVVADDTVDAVFALKDKATRELIETVTLVALKPKLEVTDMNDLFAAVQKMVTGKDVKAELEEVKAELKTKAEGKKAQKVAA